MKLGAAGLVGAIASSQLGGHGHHGRRRSRSHHRRERRHRRHRRGSTGGLGGPLLAGAYIHTIFLCLYGTDTCLRFLGGAGLLGGAMLAGALGGEGVCHFYSLRITPIFLLCLFVIGHGFFGGEESDSD